MISCFFRVTLDLRSSLPQVGEKYDKPDICKTCTCTGNGAEECEDIKCKTKCADVSCLELLGNFEDLGSVSDDI